MKKDKLYKPGITFRKPLPRKVGGPMGGKKGKKGYSRKNKKKKITNFYNYEDDRGLDYDR